MVTTSSPRAPSSSAPSQASTSLRSTTGLTFQDHIRVPPHTLKHSSRILSQSTRIHILPDKLQADLPSSSASSYASSHDHGQDDELYTLSRLVLDLGGQLTSIPHAANIVVTALSAPKRIAKHLDACADATNKFVVSPQWLHEVQRRGVLVDPDEFVVGAAARRHAGQPSDDADELQHRPKRRKLSRSRSRSPTGPSPPASTAPNSDAADRPPFPWSNTKFACKRPSPLRCINQALVDELEQIRVERRLTGDTYSEMAYMRAVSAIKAFPTSLAAQPDKASTIKGVGKKVALLVNQFYEQGRIVEAKIIRRDAAIQTIRGFTELYGIGAVGARAAWNEGCRTFEDVLGKGRSLASALTVKESLRILPDLRSPIGREECREITDVVMDLLATILPGCKHTICGGYRRGKATTYDLDIVVSYPPHDPLPIPPSPASTPAAGSPPQPQSQPPTEACGQGVGVMHALFAKMKRRGMVSHVVSISTPHDDEGGTGEKVDVAHLVLVHHGVHRRVDLVFAPEHIYGAAVLGYTGSIVFERDIRVWCRRLGYKFSFTGVTNLDTDSLVPTPSEESVFELFELPSMPPEWRNCDA